MNPVVVILLFASAVGIVASVPLIRRKVKMNHWYGVRIRAAFESEEAWFDINGYGGWLLLSWGLVTAGTALVGTLVEKKHWVAYNWAALVIIMGGLVLLVTRIHSYARKRITVQSGVLAKLCR